MPPSLGTPTQRITVVLPVEDVRTMEQRYGRGWTHRIRVLVRDDNKAYRKHRRTLEDFVSAGQTEELQDD